MITKKIYDNFEDFDSQLRDFKPKEIFYNSTPKAEAGQEVKEFGAGKDAKGEDIVQEMTVVGQRVFYIRSLAAIISMDGKDTIAIYHYETTSPLFVANQQEAAMQAEVEKQEIDKLIVVMQKTHASSFLKKGTLQLEG
jgi:hypothetical protein